MCKKKKKPALCSRETCGDCEFYKYCSICGPCCHLSIETDIIRKGPITKNCPYKVKIPKKEQEKRAKRYKALAKKEGRTDRKTSIEKGEPK